MIQPISLKVNGPTVIGGVGGSGTRLLVDMMLQMGYFMGSNLNKSNDNMTLAKYFAGFRSIIQNPRSTDEESHSIKHSLIDFKQEMLAEAGGTLPDLWGWKIPGNFFILKELSECFPNIRYIHLIRNGLDMAFSSNQNQLKKWGEHYGVKVTTPYTPRQSLLYWIKANKHAVSMANKYLSGRFMLLDFDRLCMAPDQEISNLLSFLNMPNTCMQSLSVLVKPPDSIGRYKNEDFSQFAGLIEDVKSYGYMI